MVGGKVVMGYTYKCYCDKCGREIISGTGSYIKIEISYDLECKKNSNLKSSMEVLCEECISRVISMLSTIGDK
jgi:hypothetical protein